NAVPRERRGEGPGADLRVFERAARSADDAGQENSFDHHHGDALHVGGPDINEVRVTAREPSARPMRDQLPAGRSGAVTLVRVGAAGLTTTEYVPARRCNRAVPAALVSAQPSCAPASVKAQTFAPMTGAPAGPETTTASVRAEPDAAPGASDAGGAPAWHATTR